VAGRRAIDAGASTGGFTDCLLQRGASEVIAVDVGHGQLHERLRTDPRVHVLDRTNIRHLTVADLPAGRPVDLIVADLSFISLGVVAAALLGLATHDADLVLLIKPQFEAGRAAVAKGRGVISDLGLWRTAVLSVSDAFAAAGAVIVSVVTSPLLGAQGNAEFFAHVKRTGVVDPEIDRDIEVAIDMAIEVASDMRRKAATHLLAEGR
jgi:23S rRNA (cytidine1920-2'-O)/16S rRNA (cytidine1409-2'-O)-methyltransferase